MTFTSLIVKIQLTEVSSDSPRALGEREEYGKPLEAKEAWESVGELMFLQLLEEM